MRRWRLCASLLALPLASWSLGGPLEPVDHASISAEDAARRGDAVFQHYCAICHGTRADGNGRAAKLYDPRPANLQVSRANDAYKELIIRRGGARVGRSEFMPPWEQELTRAETQDVIAYLRSICVE
jgi:mono/diheme cytochrome c family protein